MIVSCKGKRMDNKISANKLILQKQDVILIKRSEETKNTDIYGNLYEVLSSYSSLSYGKLNKDIVFDEKSRFALLHNLNSLMDHVKQEWYAKTYFEVATEETHCQLCGRKNTYVCYIANRINGEELHVGRECVKKYKDINGADIVLAKLNSDMRNLSKETRANDFDIKLGDDVDFTKYARDRVESFPVLLPYELYTNISSSIVDCNRIRTAYVSSGGNLEDVIDKFKKRKYECENLFLKADNHYMKYKEHPLICTRQIANWLSDNFSTVILDIQKNQGILNEDTLKFVHEPQFLNSSLPVFRRCLKGTDVQLLRVEGDVLRFSIQNERFVQPILFITPIKNFMRNVGCHCLTQEGYRFTKNSITPVIESNSNNFKNSMNYLIGALSKTRYNLILEERTSQLYWEKRQIVLRNKWSSHNEELKPVYKSTTTEKLYSLMENILYLDNISPNELVRIITSKIEIGGRWIPKEEKDRNVRIASEAAGMQKQREFVPYV